MYPCLESYLPVLPTVTLGLNRSETPFHRQCQEPDHNAQRLGIKIISEITQLDIHNIGKKVDQASKIDLAVFHP